MKLIIAILALWALVATYALFKQSDINHALRIKVACLRGRLADTARFSSRARASIVNKSGVDSGSWTTVITDYTADGEAAHQTDVKTFYDADPEYSKLLAQELADAFNQEY